MDSAVTHGISRNWPLFGWNSACGRKMNVCLAEDMPVGSLTQKPPVCHFYIPAPLPNNARTLPNKPAKSHKHHETHYFTPKYRAKQFFE